MSDTPINVSAGYRKWDGGFLAQLSHDLMTDFPEVKGFSKRNPKHFQRWVRFWQTATIAQQPVSQLPGSVSNSLAAANKMNFYLAAVDKQLKQEQDTASIGLLPCKHKDHLVAEYALSDVHKPIGIAEYQLTQLLPDNLKSRLPGVEAIEAELSAEWGDDDE